MFFRFFFFFFIYSYSLSYLLIYLLNFFFSFSIYLSIIFITKVLHIYPFSIYYFIRFQNNFIVLLQNIKRYNCKSNTDSLKKQGQNQWKLQFSFPSNALEKWKTSLKKGNFMKKKNVARIIVYTLQVYVYL